MTDSKRPITADDLNRIHYVQDPQFSPGGGAVAFVKVSPDPLEKSYKRNIWLYTLADGALQQLTRGDKDSSAALVAGRGAAGLRFRAWTTKPQIYLLPSDSAGRRSARLKQHGKRRTQSRTGRPMAAGSRFCRRCAAMNARPRPTTSEPQPEPADKLESKYRKERKAEDELNHWDPRPMWRIPYRQGTAYVDERYDQVYVADTAESSERKPKRLTAIDADHAAPRWSPDGEYIYISRTTSPQGDEPWRANNVYRLNAETGAEDALTDGEFSVYAPKPSPDGKWIACERSPIGVTDMPTRLLVLAVDGSESRIVNAAIDRETIDYAWSPEGALALTVESEGNVLPWRYHPESDELLPAHGGVYEIEQIDSGRGGALAMTVSTPGNPQELYVLAAGKLKEATNFNHEWLGEVIVQEVHELRYDSPNGAVQGWYILPVGPKDGDKAPLALNIHGGPHAAWGYSTKSMWHEWQFHAARGYAVFYCNPHGSGGYGEAFERKLHAAWGPVAMDDIMAGVDALLTLGFADAERMAITGGSYGGYMTAWIISHSDRFKAAVSQRGVYNISSFYGTSDVPLLMSNEFDAEPWDDHDVYWDNSPLKYAARITTPLLLIHSENDFRVPIEQAEQLFAWVRRATDTPVKMLRYPREGHELSRSGEPGHRVSRLIEMIQWFDNYVGV